MEALKAFAENTPLICHSAQFEYKWLLANGIDPKIVHDTKLLAYLYDNRIPLDLESLCLRFHIDKVFKEEWGADVASMSPERRMARNAQDSRNTKLLKDFLWKKLTRDEKFVYTEVLMPGTRTTALIENQGLCISRDKVGELVLDLESKIAELDLSSDPVIQAFEAGYKFPASAKEKKFNPNSSAHKKEILFEMLGYERIPLRHALTKKGQELYSKKVSRGGRNRVAVLEELKDYFSAGSKLLEKYLEIKHSPTLEKIKQVAAYNNWISTYSSIFELCDGGPNPCNDYHYRVKDGKDFVNVNIYMGETNTGRYKSSHPNQQNWPGRGNAWTRYPFIPRNGDKGLILEGDYDGIELRLIAGKSNDSKLIEDFLAGKDPHEQMAKDAFGIRKVSEAERDRGKTLNYAIPFGRGAEGIAFDLNVSIKEARGWIKSYWLNHPDLDKYLKGIPKEGLVRSATGMKRYCSTWEQAKNHGIQNPAFIALLAAANRTVDKMIDIAPIDLLIHDSFRQDLLDKRDLVKVTRYMKDTLEFGPEELYKWLPIPLTISMKVGPNWGAMEKYEVI